jgi:hypothetical protein
MTWWESPVGTYECHGACGGVPMLAVSGHIICPQKPQRHSTAQTLVVALIAWHAADRLVSSHHAECHGDLTLQRFSVPTPCSPTRPLPMALGRMAQQN